MSKKLWIWIAVGVVVLLAAGGAGGWFYWTEQQAEALNVESKQFAEATIKAVGAGWDIKELEKRFAPETKAKDKDGSFAKMMEVLKKLGALKQVQTLQGEAKGDPMPFTSEPATAAYTAGATFEQGPGQVQVALIKHGEAWQLTGFRVTSKVLIDPPPAQTAEAAQAAAEPAKAAAAPAKPAEPVKSAAGPAKAAAAPAKPAEPVKGAAEPAKAAAKPAPAPAVEPVAPAQQASTTLAELAPEKPARAARRRVGPDADARKCLELPENRDIARCAQPYL
jgi:hypothetical protein